MWQGNDEYKKNCMKSKSLMMACLECIFGNACQGIFVAGTPTGKSALHLQNSGLHFLQEVALQTLECPTILPQLLGAPEMSTVSKPL